MNGVRCVCEVSGAEFFVTRGEQRFLLKLDLPLPRLSPSERRRRRFAFRNERNFHRRKCARTGKDFISIFRADIPHTIYSLPAWWSDEWDPLSYGKSFDFSRPFFEQFDEVLKVCPLPGTKVVNSVNCDYTYAVLNSKNCYLSSRVDGGENILYTYLAFDRCIDCVDCFDVLTCELCYECIRCQHCYSCLHCELCQHSHDLFACYNLRGCRNCIAYFPHTREEVRQEGLIWGDDDSEVQAKPSPVPRRETASDPVLRCEVSGRPYKIGSEELKFYDRIGVDTPLRHPMQRYNDRLRGLNPHQLRQSVCAKTAAAIVTSYPAEFRGKIFSNEAFSDEFDS